LSSFRASYAKEPVSQKRLTQLIFGMKISELLVLALIEGNMGHGASVSTSIEQSIFQLT
jgi:hypothetical protein